MNGGNPWMFNPYLSMGMGMLAGNQGETGNVAFSNAMATGLAASNQAQQLMMMQQMQDAQRRQTELQNAQLERQQNALQILGNPSYTSEAQQAAALQAFPKLVVESMLQTPTISNPMRIYTEGGGEAVFGKPFHEWYAQDYKGGGPNIFMPGAGQGPIQFGGIPEATARVPDPTSPTRSRLVPEPGSPEQRKQEAAQAKMLAPLDALQDSLDIYREVLNKYGPEVMMGEGKSRIDEAYTDLLMKQKEAANLGALTGPDLALMQRMMIDPTSITAQIYEKTGRTSALTAQLDQIQQRIDDARARAKGETPQRRQGTMAAPAKISGQAEYDKLPSKAYFIGPDNVLRQKP